MNTDPRTEVFSLPGGSITIHWTPGAVIDRDIEDISDWMDLIKSKISRPLPLPEPPPPKPCVWCGKVGGCECKA